MRWSLVVGLLLGLGGCHLIFPFGPGKAPGADQGSPDLMMIADADRPGPDAAPGDQGGAADAPVSADDATMPADALASVDATTKPVDLLKAVDATPQPLDGTAPVKDAATLPKACAAGALITYSNSALTMMVCNDASKSVNQCAAHTLCNSAANWSLCTASQYLARGGKAKGWPSYAWLQSCVRSGSGVSTPTNKLCSTKCQAQPASSLWAGWSCDGSAPQFFLGWSELGVVTQSGCFRIGNVNSTAYQAHWAPRWTSSSHVAAVCCSP